MKNRREFLIAGAALALGAASAQAKAKPRPAGTNSGISGPGSPAATSDDESWRSGSNGVEYQGPHPKPGWLPMPPGVRPTGSAVIQKLLPPMRPLWELHLRDTVICLGGDGHYYMTGSSGDNIWDHNEGVELWRSADLKSWEYLGLVWSIEQDGTWERQWRTLHGKPARAVWAPEIHYLHHNYFVCLSMAPGGIAILKSRTGHPQGPYVSALSADKPLRGGIDPTLFEDTDGSVYFTYGGGGGIGRMKDDLSDLAEPMRPITLQGPNALGAGGIGRPPNRIGHEGASLFRANATYYLGAADTYQGRYSSMVAQSRTIYGPYMLLQEAVPCGGGTDYFQDKNGHWWCAFFGNDTQAPWREKPGIVPISFASDGQIHVILS